MSALARSSPTRAAARCLLMVDLIFTTSVAAHIGIFLAADSYAICNGNVSLAGNHGAFYDNVTAVPTVLHGSGGIFDSSSLSDIRNFAMNSPSRDF
eukprot:5710363-Amphidinium_carterae.1